MKLSQIREEALEFFEWSDPARSQAVSLQSCLLFTQYMLHKQKQQQEKISEDDIFSLADQYLNSKNPDCGVVDFARAVKRVNGAQS